MISRFKTIKDFCHFKTISATQQQVVAAKELFVQSLLNKETATFEAGKSWIPFAFLCQLVHYLPNY